jgi:hypothetical protein
MRWISGHIKCWTFFRIFIFVQFNFFWALELIFEIIKFLIIGMQKLALKTNWYHMLQNRCFETQVILIFGNFWNPARVLKIWKKEEKENWVGYFKIVSYLDPAVIIKTRDPPNTVLFPFLLDYMDLATFT